MDSRVPGEVPADVGWDKCTKCGGPNWNHEHDELAKKSDKGAAKQGVGRSRMAVETDLVSMVKVLTDRLTSLESRLPPSLKFTSQDLARRGVYSGARAIFEDIVDQDQIEQLRRGMGRKECIERSVV